MFPVLISHTRARVPTSSRSLIARSINSKSNRAPFIYIYIYIYIFFTSTCTFSLFTLINLPDELRERCTGCRNERGSKERRNDKSKVLGGETRVRAGPPIEFRL